MADVQSNVPVQHSRTMSWMLHACQEYEKWTQDWSDYVGKLTVENDNLRHAIEGLKNEIIQLQHRRDMQERMIDTQKDLIDSLKNDTVSSNEESVAPEALRIDPSLPLSSPTAPGEVFEPPSCTSETYSTALLRAIAESTGAEVSS